MDLMRTGYKFFRVGADEDCPISPDGARRLCDAVAKIREDQWRIKLLIVYIAAVMTFSQGGNLLEFIVKIFVG